MNESNSKETWLSRHITLHSHDTRREDYVSAVTHALGIVLSIVGTVLLVVKGISSNDTGTAFGYLLYGLSMILLFTSSTLYHLFPPNDKKRLMRIFDHLSIYLLIAGTYTPVTIAIKGVWGWSIFLTIWGLALVGMTLKVIFFKKYGFVHIIAYVLMGWMIVIGWTQLVARVDPGFIPLAIAGGVTYTVGVLVYVSKKLPFYHGIWHLFVLGGCLFFFFGVYLYL